MAGASSEYLVCPHGAGNQSRSTLNRGFPLVQPRPPKLRNRAPRENKKSSGGVTAGREHPRGNPHERSIPSETPPELCENYTAHIMAVISALVIVPHPPKTSRSFPPLFTPRARLEIVAGAGLSAAREAPVGTDDASSTHAPVSLESIREYHVRRDCRDPLTGASGWSSPGHQPMEFQWPPADAAPERQRAKPSNP